MNTLILSPLEEIIDARVLEFYEKRVGILQQLSVDSLLDNNSFAWALHHVFSIAELIDILIGSSFLPRNIAESPHCFTRFLTSSAVDF